MPTSSSTTRIWFADMLAGGLRGLRRQHDAHGRAVRLHVLDQDATMVLVDDLLHDREAETGALRFRRHVRLENAPHDAFGDAAAVVAHGAKHSARPDAGCDEDASIRD